MIDLQGKRILVTGGSAGLGAEIARQLARQGAILAINYASNSSRAEELLTLLSGGSHALVQGSAFDKQDVKKIVQETVVKLGGLDAVVSNAGWTKFGDFKDLNAVDDSDWLRCYETNVLSHVWLMQECQPHLEHSATTNGGRSGSFIISASIAGVVPSGSSMAYAVSKSATIHLAKSLAKACAPRIRVNSVSPGVLLTDWSKGFTEEHKAKVIESNALRKMSDVEDVASVYVNLIQNESITGQNVEITSGFMLG